MNMFFTAKRKTFDDFILIYDREQLNERADSPLIFCAMSNHDPESRFKIVNFLISEGADLTKLNSENECLFHTLFSRPKHNIEQSTILIKKLLEANVNINQFDKKKRLPIQYIINSGLKEDEISEWYDILFAQEGLILTEKNAWGYSPIELTQKFLPERQKLLDRMNEYVQNR